jgi:spore coat polysaccharide biosynthesis predicted glycosyltransferase SpsG
VLQEGFEVREHRAKAGSVADAKETVRIYRDAKCCFLVSDGYRFREAYEDEIATAGMPHMVIDDDGHSGHHHVDIVLNQNLYASELEYRTKGQLLLGGRYALLRSEFWKWRGESPRRTDILQRALITLGGAPPPALLEIAIRGVEDALVDAEIAAVTGFGSSGGASRARTQILEAVADMAGLMATCDVAVTAGGSTCWELAFMGVPFLVLVRAGNQTRVAQSCEEAGFALNLGPAETVTPARIATMVTGLAADRARLEQMRAAGPLAIDGWGGVRVVREMMERLLRFRTALAGDCHLFWQWANDPAVRAASFSSDPIPWEGHRAWFAATLDSPAKRLWIVEYLGEAMGQVRFDLDGREATISVSIAKDFRGSRLADTILHLASRKVMEQEDLDVIHAFVKRENEPSIRAFMKAGYTVAGPALVGETEAWRLDFIKGRVQ